MNTKCTICDAVLPRAQAGRCPECGAKAEFQVPTTESPRHARGVGQNEQRAWEFGPDGPRLRRIR